MSKIPGFMLRHRITVEPLLGQGPYGPSYGPPVEVRCFLDEQTRTVRDASGEDVVSSSTARCRLEETAPTGSRVTLPGGRQTTVLVALRRDGGGFPTPDHLEVQME